MNKYIKLLLSVALCEGAGLVGSIFTVNAVNTWYITLNKPSFNPPSWIFAPVWTSLYLLMGISLYFVWTKRKVPFVFWVQLILNASWSMVFFGLRSPALALVNILVLWVVIILTIKSFYKINKKSAYLLYPYFAWVSFAAILNYYIWILNK